MTAENPPNAKRRRFQFSIRTMLIGFLAVALVLGLARDYGWRLAWRRGWDPAFKFNEYWPASNIRPNSKYGRAEASAPTNLAPPTTPRRVSTATVARQPRSLQNPGRR